jgi:hypothetical protein
MHKLTHDSKVFYSKPQDEKSSSLFRAWLLHFLDENNEHILESIGTMFNKGYFTDKITELKNIGLVRHIYDFFVNCQIGGYFNYNFLKPVENEIYIDCGVLDGGTIKEFFDFTNGRYNKIYGFEPDDSSYRRTLYL